MAFWCYMLRCADGKYYVGHTEDIDVRLWQHNEGITGGYTSKRRPVELVWCEAFAERIEAKEAERRIKGWSRVKKEALIERDWEKLQVLARNWQGHPTDRPSTGSGLRCGVAGTSEELRSPEPVERQSRTAQ